MIHQIAQAIFKKMQCGRSSSLKASTYIYYDESIMPKISFPTRFLCLFGMLFTLVGPPVFAQDSSKTQKPLEEKSKQTKSTQDKSQKNNKVQDNNKVQEPTNFDRQIDETEGKARLNLIFKDFKKAAQTYLGEAQSHRQIQNELFTIKYQDKSMLIEKRHKPSIDDASNIESKQRQASIERFRSFLNTHPPHPQYTPDSLYRLGMLLLEEQDADYVKRVEEYNKRVSLISDEIDIPFPQRDHREVSAIFTQLIKDWPAYRELDAALYARGYSYLEMGEEQLALRDFKSIIKNFPNSDYRIEVWNLIGELHFDFAELSEAINAYKEAIKDQESKYYASAYYKLAWTYYRNDQFEEAVEAFKALISYSDQKVASGKKGFELRNEALQYLAISLNEDDWDDDGITDLNAGFKRVARYLSSQEGYQAELLDKLVDIFFDNTKYEESIQTALYLFKTHPHYRRNPEIHSKIITAYERIAQPEKAFDERDNFTNVYVINGPWYASNHRDQEALDKARGLMKDSLLQAGTYHHERAQSFRGRAEESEGEDQVVLSREARSSYYKAALSYQRYLERYRKDDNTYELLYLYADALYYSEEYERSFKQYLLVRDSKLGDEHQEESAFSAVLSHVEILKKAIAKGELQAKQSLVEEERDDKDEVNNQPSDEEGSEPKRVTPEAIPALAQQAIAIREDYLKLGLSNEEDPYRVAVLKYKVGEIYMDYLNYEPGRKKLIDVIEQHPKSPVAVNAANLLIESYRLERDWVAMAQWAEKIAQAGLGDEMVAQAKVWKVGALFKTAKALFDKKQYKDAAKEYITLVDQNPDNEFAAAALNNGAVAFEKARMFDSAMRTYERIFNQFPGSEFSENALFRVAYNAERFYDYNRAVKTFVQLAKRYPNGENAADAAYNAARLLEQTQDYKAAAKAYQDYAKRFSDKDNAAEVFFATSKCYEKLGDWRKQIKIYNRFIKNYGDDPKQNDRVIMALAKTVSIYKKHGRSRQITKARKRLISNFEVREMKPGSYVSRFPAEASFEMIEVRFKAFKRLKIKGNMKQQGKIITKMKGEVAGLTEDYSNLLKYKSLDWNIAALYRIGLLRQIFAAGLYELPIPAGLSIEEEDIYTTQIEEIAIPIEDEAVLRFEAAFKKAREFRISNEWTKKILLSLNKYKPAEYPTFKDEKRLETPSSRSNTGFILPKEAVKNNAEEEEVKEEVNSKSTEDRAVKVGKREVKKPQASNSNAKQGDANGTTKSQANHSAPNNEIEAVEALDEVKANEAPTNNQNQVPNDTQIEDIEEME